MYVIGSDIVSDITLALDIKKGRKRDLRLSSVAHLGDLVGRVLTAKRCPVFHLVDPVDKELNRMKDLPSLQAIMDRRRNLAMVARAMDQKVVRVGISQKGQIMNKDSGKRKLPVADLMNPTSKRVRVRRKKMDPVAAKRRDPKVSMADQNHLLEKKLASKKRKRRRSRVAKVDREMDKRVDKEDT